MRRVQGVTVTSHFCKIQDKDADFYRAFQVIVLGLDSIEGARAAPGREVSGCAADVGARVTHPACARRAPTRPTAALPRAARRWINSMVCSLVTFEPTPDGGSAPDLSSVIPLIDGGTEGLKGHARVIFPRVSACFECTLDLFPPQLAVPLCTIAETPRNAAHCILYAHLILRDREMPDAPKPDTDDPEYQQWVFAKAAQRAATFGIGGVTLSHTQVGAAIARRLSPRRACVQREASLGARAQPLPPLPLLPLPLTA